MASGSSRPCRAAALAALLAAAAAAAETNAPPVLRVARGARFGFVGRDGRLIAAPQYAYGGDWQDGVLWVRRDDADPLSGALIGPDGRPRPAPPLGDVAPVLPERPDPWFERGVAAARTSLNAFVWIDAAGRVLFDAPPAAVAARGDGPLLMAQGGRCGYGTPEGAIAIPPRFADARPFRDGVAAVRTDRGWGLIDLQGRLVAPDEFESLAEFAPGLWLRRARGRAGLVARDGTARLAPAFEDLAPGDAERAAARQDGRWGVVRLRDGKWIVPAQFDEVGGFGDGVVLLRQGRLWGVAKDGGEWVLPPQFDAIPAFDEASGVWWAYAGGKVGLLRRDGRLAAPPQYDSIGSPRGGVCDVTRDGKRGLITPDGRVVAEPQFDGLKGFELFARGVGFASVTGRWGMLRVRTGAWIVPPAFDDLAPWNELVAARRAGVRSLLDAEGRAILAESAGITRLPDPEDMPGGFGVAWAETRAGLMDRGGRIVLPCGHEDLGVVSEGLVAAKRGGPWGYLDLAGAWAIPPAWEAAGPFSEGWAAVKRGGRFGFITRDGAEALRPQFDAAGPRWHGLLPVARAVAGGGRAWGLVDLRGEPVLPPDYDALEWPDPARGGTAWLGVPAGRLASPPVLAP